MRDITESLPKKVLLFPLTKVFENLNVRLFPLESGNDIGTLVTHTVTLLPNEMYCLYKELQK